MDWQPPVTETRRIFPRPIIMPLLFGAGAESIQIKPDIDGDDESTQDLFPDGYNANYEIQPSDPQEPIVISDDDENVSENIDENVNNNHHSANSQGPRIVVRQFSLLSERLQFSNPSQELPQCFNTSQEPAPPRTPDDSSQYSQNLPQHSQALRKSVSSTPSQNSPPSLDPTQPIQVSTQYSRALQELLQRSDPPQRQLQDSRSSQDSPQCSQELSQNPKASLEAQQRSKSSQETQQHSHDQVQYFNSLQLSRQFSKPSQELQASYSSTQYSTSLLESPQCSDSPQVTIRGSGSQDLPQCSQGLPQCSKSSQKSPQRSIPSLESLQCIRASQNSPQTSQTSKQLEHGLTQCSRPLQESQKSKPQQELPDDSPGMPRLSQGLPQSSVPMQKPSLCPRHPQRPLQGPPQRYRTPRRISQQYRTRNISRHFQPSIVRIIMHSVETQTEIQTTDIGTNTDDFQSYLNSNANVAENQKETENPNSENQDAIERHNTENCHNAEKIVDRDITVTEKATTAKLNKNELKMIIKTNKKAKMYYKCKICSCFYIYPRWYQEHVLTAHNRTAKVPKRKFQVLFDPRCKFCKYKAKNSYDYNSHVKLKHPETWESEDTIKINKTEEPNVASSLVTELMKQLTPADILKVMSSNNKESNELLVSILTQLFTRKNM